jgi:glycosyltransferase involved in cell wall biosynthesis
LRGNPEQAERLAAGAAAFSREHFDWKKNAGALAAFYRQIGASAEEQQNVITISS